MARGTVKKWTLRVAPAGIYAFLRLLQSTIRWAEVNPDLARTLWAQGQKMIFVFWHGRMLMTPFFYRGRGVKILISHHSDGELICRVMARFGFQGVRGSTRRRGTKAFRELLRTSQAGWDIAITPDGPRGPRHVIQKGVIELARQTGLPIYPASYSTRRRIHCPSWDALLIPVPFTRGVLLWGRPLWVPADAQADEMEAYRRQLELQLCNLTSQADAFFDRFGDLV